MFLTKTSHKISLISSLLLIAFKAEEVWIQIKFSCVQSLIALYVKELCFCA